MPKKIKTVLCIVACLVIAIILIRVAYYGIVFITVGNLGIGGAGDWVYDLLPGNYEIWRSSQYQVTLDENDHGMVSRVVGPCIIAFSSKDNYIALERIPDWDGQLYTEESVQFFIVDAGQRAIIGPMDQKSFLTFSKELGVSFEQWIQTDQRPDMAID